MFAALKFFGISSGFSFENIEAKNHVSLIVSDGVVLSFDQMQAYDDLFTTVKAASYWPKIVTMHYYGHGNKSANQRDIMGAIDQEFFGGWAYNQGSMYSVANGWGASRQAFLYGLSGPNFSVLTLNVDGYYSSAWGVGAGDEGVVTHLRHNQFSVNGSSTPSITAPYRGNIIIANRDVSTASWSVNRRTPTAFATGDSGIVPFVGPYSSARYGINCRNNTNNPSLLLPAFNSSGSNWRFHAKCDLLTLTEQQDFSLAVKNFTEQVSGKAIDSL